MYYDGFAAALQYLCRVMMERRRRWRECDWRGGDDQEVEGYFQVISPTQFFQRVKVVI